ncbi:unnamed protein product [Rhizoctonia solani]|nr:unnamed protein product [Rhizoctonia solani]
MFNRVGIFWDYNACPTNDARESNTIRLLRKECIKHGNIVLFKAYFGLPGIAPHKQPPASIRSEIEEAGVTTLNHPNAGFGAFATDVFCFLLDQDKSTTPTTVVLVSGNPNITYLVYALHARGVRVGLIAPSGQLNELSSQISWTKDWEDYTRITNISISHDDTIPPGVASTKSAKHHSNHGLIDSS